MEPDYLVTREYFTNAPRHVALLPFAARSGRERDARNAQVTRTAFYQHLVPPVFRQRRICGPWIAC